MTGAHRATRHGGRGDHGRRTMRLVAGLAALVVAVVVLAGSLWWRSSGGHWFVVRTPSMGQAAPVGTLLLTRPTSVAGTRIGEVITFHSPSGETYSHRVVQKTAAGLRTRGDINGVVDPWTLTDRDLVGKVVARWWGIGWALRALPLLLFGMAIAWTLAAVLARRRPTWRDGIRQLGTTVSVAATMWWLHPWVGVEKLGLTSLAASHGRAPNAAALRVVSTGVLPIRVQDVAGGPGADLRAGQVADVAMRQHGRSTGYNLDAALHLSLGWWIAVIAFCLAPLAWSVLTAPRVVPSGTAVA